MSSLRTPIDKAPEPELGHQRIPKERYISPEFMEIEWQRMWMRVWLLAGRVDDIEQPGQFFTFNAGRESVLIVRTEASEIKAFRNVCQHRGNRLCQSRSGQVGSLQCRYHFWEWNLAGTLKHVPAPETYPQGLPADTLTLKAVACDVWGGLVWINLNPEAEPLHEFLGIIPEHLDPYHFERFYLAEDYSVEWECNWKTSVDAFNEAYHSQALHPQIAAYLDDFRIQTDLYERHTRYLVPMMIPSPRYPDQENPNPALAEMAEMVGLDASQYRGRLPQLRTDFQQAKRALLTKQGIDCSDLNDDQMSDDYHYTIFPNIQLNLMANECWLFRQLPHPKDPDCMTFDFHIYRALAEGQERPPRPETQFGKGARFSFNNEVLDQDAQNLPGVQQGMHSDGFEGFWLSHQERRIRHFHHTLVAYLAENT